MCAVPVLWVPVLWVPALCAGYAVKLVVLIAGVAHELGAIQCDEAGHHSPVEAAAVSIGVGLESAADEAPVAINMKKIKMSSRGWCLCATSLYSLYVWELVPPWLRQAVHMD